MKNLFTLLITYLLLLSSCEEQMVVIPELTGSESNRKILIEEFTGANCSACPQGAAAIKDLQSIYDKGVISVAIHTYVSGSLGQPISGSKYDLRTNYGDDIALYLGSLSSIPAAAIDRKLYDGQSGLPIAPFSAWSGIVNNEIEEAPELLIIDLKANFDPGTRMLNIKGNILPNQAVEGDIRIVGYITESHIIDKQLNGTEVIDEYSHDHVLRDVLAYKNQEPTIEGASLPTPIGIDEIIPFEFAPYTVPDEDGTWVAENCHVVVFIVRYDADSGSRIVLQADEVDFTP